MPGHQRVGARRSVVPGLPAWGLGVELTTAPPVKFTATKPWRRPRPTQGCSASKEEEEEEEEEKRIISIGFPNKNLQAFFVFPMPVPSSTHLTSLI
jgi:hypothetical protein